MPDPCCSAHRRNAVGAAVILLACSAFLTCSVLFVAPAGATKFAGAFMENGAGARALGMGSAFTAIADDPSATFWNPAGLAVMSRRQILAMHEEAFGGLVKRDFGAYVQPVNWNLLGGDAAGFGVSIFRLGVDDIPMTAQLEDQLDTNHDGQVDNSEVLGLFNLQDQIYYRSDQELALLVSYGERHGSWQYGGTMKLIRQNVVGFSSLGIGFDLALLRPRIWRNLDFGLKLQDITTTYLSWSTGTNELITPCVAPGLAYRIPMPQWNMGLLLAGSMEWRADDRGHADQIVAGDFSANAHLGAEVAFRDRVFLRGGFNSGFGSKNLTAGAGFRINPLTVDYAYAGDTLDNNEVTHRISLSARF